MTDVIDRFHPRSLSDKEWYYPRSAATLSGEQTLSAGAIIPASTNYYYGYSSTAYSLVNVSFFDPYENISKLREAAAALYALLQLPEGWDSYGAPRISGEAVSISWTLLRQLLWADFPLPRIVPTADGGVQLEWYGNNIDVQIEATSSHDISVFYRDVETGESWEGALGEEPRPLADIIRRAASSNG
jgi:hypothetical protein